MAKEPSNNTLSKDLSRHTLSDLSSLAMGLVADNTINQKEAEFLKSWLSDHRSIATNSVIKNLYQRVLEMLADDLLDQYEAIELLATLKAVSKGDYSSLDEPSKLESVFCDPEPAVDLEGSSFVLTGTFKVARRPVIERQIALMGGIVEHSVSRSIDFVVVGDYASDGFSEGELTGKIARAVSYREGGARLAIIREERLMNAFSAP